jgi:hypothetical protein
MKITNRKTTVTLTKDFKCGMVEYKKGEVFDARLVREVGLVIITGHGMNEVIPHDHLGTYEETWNETTVEGATTITKKMKADVTKDYEAHWKKLIEKENARVIRQKKMDVKRMIANLRKNINFVQTGQAEKELKNLLGELENLG